MQIHHRKTEAFVLQQGCYCNLATTRIKNLVIDEKFHKIVEA